MGNAATKMCGAEGPTKMLMKEYGDDVGRFIAVEKSKQTVDTKVTEVKSKITTETDAIQSRCIGEITTRQQQMEDEFTAKIKELDSKMFGGISAFEKLKGQTVREMVGLESLKARFTALQGELTGKINEERGKVLQQVDDAASEGKRKIDEQKPAIPLYDKLPAAQQRTVFKEGEKLFKEQIAEQESQIMKELEAALNPETYLGNIRSIVPAGGASDIMSTFQSKMTSISDMMKGTGSLGNLKKLF